MLPLKVIPKLICLGSLESDFGEIKFDKMSSVRTISVDESAGTKGANGWFFLVIVDSKSGEIPII